MLLFLSFLTLLSHFKPHPVAGFMPAFLFFCLLVVGFVILLDA